MKLCAVQPAGRFLFANIAISSCLPAQMRGKQQLKTPQRFDLEFRNVFLPTLIRTEL